MDYSKNSILLVEDNPGDARLVFEAFREAGYDSAFHVVKDGVEALAYLHQLAEYTDAALPNLILLDLNLPRKDGREVLAEIKADDDLKRIPVIILTTSNSEDDIVRTYDLHANCYITKPVDINHFIDIVRAIDDFWLSTVSLPPK